MNCWHILGIAPTGDEAAIKTAYAALVRAHRPDRDPAGFRRIRAAYEEALRLRPHYEHRSDGPRRPSAAPDGHDTAPNNPPAPAAAQPYPPAAPAYTHANPPATATPDGFTFTLTEPAAHGYRDTPPTATEQPFPLAEPAAHDYQDSSARPALTPLNATLLLRQLQQAWQGQDDAALLAILQAQATHPALDNIDFRLDYTGALTACLDDGDYPRCRLWVQQHYGLHDPDSRRLLADLIAADGDPALRDSILAAHYPALAAWLKQNRLRRWWALRRRFLVCDPGPVWQDWLRLYNDTGDIADEHYFAAWPRLKQLMRYHLPLAGLRYGWFIDIAICFLLPAYAAYTRPGPNPYAAYRCIICPAAPATSPEYGLPLAAILITWLLLRSAHILWRTKYAITAGWRPPRPQDDLPLHLASVLYILGLIYSLIPPAWRPLPAQPLVQSLTAILGLILYGHSWCRLPPEAVNLRRAMLDHGVIAVLIAAACITGAITDSADSPLLTVLGLIAAPLLALVLIYSHYPPLFNRKTAKGLVVADTAVMALGICVLGYIILRQEMSRPVAALFSLLTAGIFIHFNPPKPETIPRSLLAALFRLFTLIGLYSAAVFALFFLMGRIIDAGYGLLPALTLLALYALHITATFIHSNRQQHA